MFVFVLFSFIFCWFGYCFGGVFVSCFASIDISKLNLDFAIDVINEDKLRICSLGDGCFFLEIDLTPELFEFLKSRCYK